MVSLLYHTYDECSKRPSEYDDDETDDEVDDRLLRAVASTFVTLREQESESGDNDEDEDDERDKVQQSVDHVYNALMQVGLSSNGRHSTILSVSSSGEEQTGNSRRDASEGRAD